MPDQPPAEPVDIWTPIPLEQLAESRAAVGLVMACLGIMLRVWA